MYLWTCAPNEDLDQTVHLCSLIRNFTKRILDSQGRKKKTKKKTFMRTAKTQADLSLHWAHMSEGMFSPFTAHMLSNRNSVRRLN